MKKIPGIRFVYNCFYILAAVAVIASCTKKGSGTPTSNGIKPDSAASGVVLTLTGSGLSNMRSIVFDKNNAPSAFNPNFNTDNAVIFRVPDTAAIGAQNIVLTNADGKVLKIAFKVLALAAVTSANIYEFTAGS